MHLYTKLGQHERAVGLALELHTDTDRKATGAARPFWTLASALEPFRGTVV